MQTPKKIIPASGSEAGPTVAKETPENPHDALIEKTIDMMGFKGPNDRAKLRKLFLDAKMFLHTENTKDSCLYAQTITGCFTDLLNILAKHKKLRPNPPERMARIVPALWAKGYMNALEWLNQLAINTIVGLPAEKQPPLRRKVDKWRNSTNKILAERQNTSTHTDAATQSQPTSAVLRDIDGDIADENEKTPTLERQLEQAREDYATAIALFQVKRAETVESLEDYDSGFEEGEAERLATIIAFSPSVELKSTEEETEAQKPTTQVEELEQLRAENKKLERATARYEGASADLYDKIDYLEGMEKTLGLRAMMSPDLPEETTQENAAVYPSTLKDLRTWAKENLGDRVIIAESAFNAAADSDYARPHEVYRALEILGNEYHAQMCSGDLPEAERKGLRAAFTNALNENHLSVKRTGTFLGSSKGAYNTIIDGKTYFMDSQLARGNSHDTRHTMRVYFTWDSDRKATIVGHLPSHLGNKMS